MASALWQVKRRFPVRSKGLLQLHETEAGEGFESICLADFVRIKLIVFGDKDRMNLRDLISVGLVDGSWASRYPEVLGGRLQGGSMIRRGDWKRIKNRELRSRRAAPCVITGVGGGIPACDHLYLFMKTNRVSPSGLALAAGIFLVTPAFAVVNIDFVPVGNAGNAADTVNPGYGAVAYDYKIAKNETTISQYAVFLNAVAKTDSYGLYRIRMTSSTIDGITQSGTSGTFTYSVNPGSENKPITFVSWFDAARFSNWMHNGQLTGAQDASTTEDGAYTLSGAVSGVTVNKNVGATVWIPSEDEWYKAAYYDPTKNAGAGGYWLQATQSDTLAGNTVGVANSANYNDGDYVGSGTSIFPTTDALTDGGAYGANSESFYGTNDQAGNVWEWNDAKTDSTRGLRGGSWSDASYNLPASYRNEFVPTFESATVGFRVASVPEPTSLVLTMLASGLMLVRRKR
jgi:sulfatase modifying factor 1